METSGAELIARAEGETLALARWLGRRLAAGDVVALTGPLGAGKTVFTRGLAAGAGIADPRAVTSPTFVLLHRYPGPLTVYHLDAYRVSGAGEFRDLGVEDWLGLDGVTVIEWADRVESLLPPAGLRVALAHRSPTERSISVLGSGDRNALMVKELRQLIASAPAGMPRPA